MFSIAEKSWWKAIVNLLLSFYLAFVFVGKTLIDICYRKRIMLAYTGKVYYYFLYLLFFLAAVAVFYWILARCFGNARGVFHVHAEMGRRSIGLFITVFLLVLGYYLALFYTNYPGGISTDNASQWEQAHTMQINDHHPAFHTLLIFLLTRICDSYAFLVLLQLMVMAFGIASVASTLRAWGVSMWAVVGTVLILALGVQTQEIIFFAWKDMTMSLLVLLLLTPVINIFLSHGQWLRKPFHWIYVAVLLAGITLVRHNAILLTLPMLVLLVITYRGVRRSSLLAGALCLLLVLGVKGPLYHALNVTPAASTYAETIGLPMTILSSSYSQKPEQMPEEAYAFMQSLADQEAFAEVYEFGNYNSVKWHFGITQDQISAAAPSPLQVLKMAWDTFRANAVVSVKSVVELTDMVWEPVLDQVNIVYVFHGYQLGDDSLTINPELREFCYEIKDMVNNSVCGQLFETLSSQIGFLILVMLLAWYISQKEHGLTGLWLLLPVLCYNFGTMLLLCGDDYRFFHFNCFVAYPIAILLLSRRAAPKQETDTL